MVRQTWVLDADAPQVQLVHLVYGLHECGWNVSALNAHAEVVLPASLPLVAYRAQALMKGIAHHEPATALTLVRAVLT